MNGFWRLLAFHFFEVGHRFHLFFFTVAFQEWKRNGEDGALRTVVGNVDAAFHHVNILLHDVQAEPAALLFLPVGFLHEAFEDVLLVVYADARVGHAEHHLSALCLLTYGKRNDDGAVVGVVFEGVRQQVLDDAVHLVLVEIYLNGVRRQPQFLFDVFVHGIIGELLHGLPYEAHDVAVLEVQFLLSHVKAAEVEQLQNEVVELPRVSPCHVELGAYVWREWVFA